MLSLTDLISGIGRHLVPTSAEIMLHLTSIVGIRDMDVIGIDLITSDIGEAASMSIRIPLSILEHRHWI